MRNQLRRAIFSPKNAGLQKKCRNLSNRPLAKPLSLSGATGRSRICLSVRVVDQPKVANTTAVEISESSRGGNYFVKGANCCATCLALRKPSTAALMMPPA
jgi:hypothetical protein